MTIGAGETILASDIQAIKDDVDKFTDASEDSVSASESTTSTSFTDLATAGPSVTVTTGTLALVIVTARMSNNTAAGRSAVDFAVSGATTRAAAISTSLFYQSSNADDSVRASAATFVTLTAGSNTFTLKYRVLEGTGTFDIRRIAVLPIGA